MMPQAGLFPDLLDSPAVEALGRALLHFLWQGAVAAACLWFALAECREAPEPVSRSPQNRRELELLPQPDPRTSKEFGRTGCGSLGCSAPPSSWRVTTHGCGNGLRGSNPN